MELPSRREWDRTSNSLILSGTSVNLGAGRKVVIAPAKCRYVIYAIA